MAKIYLFIVSAFLLAACNDNCQVQSGSVQKSESNTVAACPTPSPDPAPVPPPIPNPDPTPDPGEDLPHEAFIFDAKVNFFGFERSQEDKALRAIEIIKKVIASSEFRARVLNFTHQGKKEFVDNKGLTNAQIYQVLLDGQEDLLPVVDNEMDLELELFYTWRDTVGYTTPGALRIYMNTKFFNPYTPSQVAGNLFHEWTHKLGFEHAQTYTISRDSSVPYALGFIVAELGKKYESSIWGDSPP
jgi:hypothetical protein